MKLRYEGPRRPDIIPAPFRRLDRRRGPRWSLLVAILLLLGLSGLIGWIWWSQNEPDQASPTASPQPGAIPSSPPTPVPSVTPTPRLTQNAQPSPAPQSAPPYQSPETDPETGLRLQAALARLAFSPGPLDGLVGGQTRAALKAFQKARGLRPTGSLDATTRAQLDLAARLYTFHTVTAEEVARLRRTGRTWLAKSRQDRLDYETIIELIAERSQSDEDLIARLNSTLDWRRIGIGTVVKIPDVAVQPPASTAAFIRISLGDRALQVFGGEEQILAHFPCSIGQAVHKRPVGFLQVTTVVPDPNYTFDPAIFPESPEARELDHKLILQPGPNNPVGTVWIGLDRPGYGIHGTPAPEKVGRTESHGCFRLANWNAEHLLKLVWVGLPVHVEP